MTMHFSFYKPLDIKIYISPSPYGPNWSHLCFRQWQTSMKLLSFLSRRQGIADMVLCPNGPALGPRLLCLARERHRYTAPPLNSSRQELWMMNWCSLHGATWPYGFRKLNWHGHINSDFIQERFCVAYAVICDEDNIKGDQI